MSDGALISIIIPVYREPLAILTQLHRLAGCPRIEQCEVIVVDGDAGSTMTPSDITPATIITTQPGRGHQLNAGAASSSAPVLLFLHVDTFLPRGFVGHIMTALRRVEAGAFDLSIESAHPIVRLISFTGMIRSRLTRRPYGDQAQFLTRGLFERVGGFPEAPLMEDVGIMERISSAGERVAMVTSPARTSDRRWRREGAVAGTLRNWRLLLAYRAGVPPAVLVRRYRPQAELDRSSTRHMVFYRTLREFGVKTRLAAEIGAANAVSIYEACLRDLARVVRSSGIETHWFADDPLAGTPISARDIPQHGKDLFARMADAFIREFAAGSERAVLTGSDLPGLTPEILHRAVSVLRSADAVLGPTLDGGYYLLGFTSKAFSPGLLEPEREMTAESAGSVTARSIRRAGLRLVLLPVLRDLDTATDLRAIIADRNVAAPALRREVARRDLNLSVY